jgi:hypothetical protein
MPERKVAVAQPQVRGENPTVVVQTACEAHSWECSSLGQLDWQRFGFILQAPRIALDSNMLLVVVVGCGDFGWPSRKAITLSHAVKGFFPTAT